MLKCTFENGNQFPLRHVTVGCLVVKDNKVLLAKRSDGLLEAGKWYLPGGYVIRDETTVEAAARETMEETGWAVRNLHLLCVNDNPNRANQDHQNINFIYVAEAVDETGKKNWKNADVQWFSLDELPPKNKIAFDNFDSIELYKKYLKEHFNVPIVGSL